MNADKFKESCLYKMMRIKDDWGLSYRQGTHNIAYEKIVEGAEKNLRARKKLRGLWNDI